MASVTRLTTDEPVFNLEVHGEHVYEVGRSGVLVHNTTAAAQCKEFLDQLGKLEAKGTKESLAAAEALVKSRVDEILKRAGSLTADEQKQLAMLADKYASEALPLGPYGGKGGVQGHHAAAKKGMDGDPLYDKNAALSISDEVLESIGVKHADITGQQTRFYKAFVKTQKIADV